MLKFSITGIVFSVKMDTSNESALYRLEGTDKNQTGGLVIRKKPSDHTFKKPQVSVLGLDKLAKRKRQENAQESKSFKSESGSPKSENKERKYRSYAEETPTHTGGVNYEAQKRLESRLKHQRLSAQDKNYRHGHKDRDRDRNRDRERSRSRDSARQTPLRFKDEPQTPVFKTRVSIGSFI